MQFSVDADNGTSISGWLAPDNPTAIPSFIVRIPGHADFCFEANVDRLDIVELGFHSTGRVGFRIDTSLVPALADSKDVTLLEAENHLPLHRRFQPDLHVEKKLFVFDASIMPQRRIVAALDRSFALNYPNFEQHGLETAVVAIHAPLAKSMLVTGRPNFNRFGFWLNELGFVRAALVREPFEELAERLLFLSLILNANAQNACAPYLTGVAPLLDLVRDLPLTDAKAMKRVFKEANEEQQQALASPMTRSLGCEIGEMPSDAHVSRALDNLAAMDVVGTRERYDLFKTLLAARLGSDLIGDELPASFQSVQTLATTLKRTRVVEEFLAEDLRLYAFVRDAIKAGQSLRQ